LCRKGQLNGPSLSNSVVDCLPADSEFPSPLRKGQLNPVLLIESASARIAHLSLRFGPLAVVLAIRNVVIFSINRMFGRWAFAHVIKEALEVQPFVANGNSASSVSLPPFGFGVEATSHHVAPRRVGSRATHPMFYFGHELL